MSLYRPRTLRFLGTETLGEWRMKTYAITLPGAALRPELVAATIANAASLLPAAP